MTTLQSTVVIALAVTVVIVALILAVDPFGSSSEASRYRDLDDPAICVDLSEAAAEETNLSQDEVETMVKAALPSPDDIGFGGWVSPGQEITVESPCPGGVRLDCPEGRRVPPVMCNQVVVERFSRYGLFLFVVSSSEFDIATSWSDGESAEFMGRWGSLEGSCTGDICMGNTSSYYVTSAEFLDVEELSELLVDPLRVGEGRRHASPTLPAGVDPPMR